MMHRLASRLRSDEQGAIAAQAAAMVPLLTIVVVVVLFTGRVVEANNTVQAAAHEAARAATLAGSEAGAADAAQAIAAANLNAGGLACRTLSVVPDLSRFHPGGSVTVTVTCTADFADMDLIGVPGSRSFTASAIEVIDTYRGG